MRVLLATDGSSAADRARDLVARLPWPKGTTVRVIAGLEARGELFGTPWVMPSRDDLDVMEAQLVRHVEDTLADAERSLERPGLTVERIVLRDRPATAIVTEAVAWGADLIMVGSRGHGRIASMLLGSVSAEVVDHAPCPVLVVREATIGSIVVADDGSGGAAHALHVLTDWPVFRHLPVTVVSVAETEIPWSTGMAAGLYDEVMASYARDVDVARAESRTIAEEAAGRLRAAGLAATAELREGDPAHELIEAARSRPQALLVLGTHGRSGLARLVLGSVTRNVLLHAPGSVLVVRETAAVRPDDEGPNA